MAKGKETATGEKEQQGRGGGDWGSTAFFKRETEHLCIRPPIHGIGEGVHPVDPRARR